MNDPQTDCDKKVLAWRTILLFIEVYQYGRVLKISNFMML